MRTADVETAAIGLLSRVVVRGRTSVGCRPVVAPEGRVIERGQSGLFRVLFPDGSRQWYWPEEAPFMMTGSVPLRPGAWSDSPLPPSRGL